MDYDDIGDEIFDNIQAIARAGFGDMLHDWERNNKYYKGIKEAIKTLRYQGKSVHVLDIGTGTGLLSMMAAKCNADSVTACEAFEPMADCAVKVIKDNSLEDKIKVIKKHSTELKVGVGLDMDQKANLLVAELLDTELIGEGALRTYRHAIANLLEADCLCVPHSAEIYVQIVNSSQLLNWNTLLPLELKNSDVIYPSNAILVCPGGPSLHDLQLNEFPLNNFNAISKPLMIFKFTFNDLKTLLFDEQKLIEVQSLISGACHGLFFWWQIDMDVEGKIQLNCGPHWANSQSEWRDHWMQAVYYFPEILQVEKDEIVQLEVFHDEYSFWFDIHKQPSTKLSRFTRRPCCECGLHIGASRQRLAMINDPERKRFFTELLEKEVTSSSVILCLNEVGFIPLICAKLNAKKVFVLLEHKLNMSILEELIISNGLEGKIEIIDGENTNFTDLKINLVINEPYFADNVFPWDNLRFWFSSSEFKHLFSPEVKILPEKATIKAIAVKFKDLDKLRNPVGETEGFKLRKFDELIQDAILSLKETVEPHTLWEYPGIALTEPFTIGKLNYNGGKDNLEGAFTGSVPFPMDNIICNGIIIWLDYSFCHNQDLSTGPHGSIKIGTPLGWNFYNRPGVYFIEPSLVGADKSLVWDIVPSQEKVSFKIIDSIKEK